MSYLFLTAYSCSRPLLKYSTNTARYFVTEKYFKLLKKYDFFNNFKIILRTYVDVSEDRITDDIRGLDWRDVVLAAKQIVGHPTPYLTLRSLLDDETAKTALQLRKLLCSNHPLLKSTKNVLFGSKYELQSLGLMVMLTSKAAGFSTERFSKEEQALGILHSQRILSEIVEMQWHTHLLHSAVNQQKNIGKYNDVQKFFCENNINISDASLETLMENLNDPAHSEITALITKGLENLVRSENLGPRNKHNDPMPSQPKAIEKIERYLWKTEDDLINMSLEDVETFLGHGKDEWMYRTMLSSGNILGNACRCAMMLARKDDLEMDAYTLGSHMAVLWQLHLDLKDFYVHPHSFSYVGAPLTIALWEYPMIYSIFIESKIGKTEVEHRQVYYAVRSTRAMDYITYFLESELEIIFKYSDKFPGKDARCAIQKMAMTVYKEALEYIE